MLTAHHAIAYHEKMRELEAINPTMHMGVRDRVVRHDYGLTRFSKKQLKNHQERLFEGVYDITSLVHSSSDVNDLVDSANFDAEQLESKLSQSLRRSSPEKTLVYTVVSEDDGNQVGSSFLRKRKVVVHSIDKTGQGD